MPPRKNLIGNRYGMLTVVSCKGPNKHGAIVWECLCDCGRLTTAHSYDLEHGIVVSCGCKKKKIKAGDKFGRLTALEPVKHGKNFYWKCKCECGNIVDVLAGNLRKGNSTSCGCFAHELVSKSSKTHGHSKSRLYKIWEGMKQRCYNPHVKAYKYYGEKGISVCDEWMSYEPFEKWALSHGYSDDLSIDRIDCCGNYCPDNCRWVTKLIQSNNTSTNTFIFCDGKKMTLAQWSRELNISSSVLSWRKAHGWSDEECIKGKT